MISLGESDPNYACATRKEATLSQLTGRKDLGQEIDFRQMCSGAQCSTISTWTPSDTTIPETHQNFLKSLIATTSATLNAEQRNRC